MARAKDYVDGTYLQQNPDWHVPDSPWKAEQIVEVLRRNKLSPQTVFDAGCGAGEVLRLLQQQLGSGCELWGTDVAPKAIALAQTRANDRLHFEVWEGRPWPGRFFDLVLSIDVLAHVEDYREYLREIKSRGAYKLIHIQLDLSVQHLLRQKSMIERRKIHSHLHYFTKQTAMFALADAGYEIVDWFYTPRQPASIDTPALKRRGMLLKLPRKIVFGLSPELAANLLGGYSLMALAK